LNPFEDPSLLIQDVSVSNENPFEIERAALPDVPKDSHPIDADQSASDKHKLASGVDLDLNSKELTLARMDTCEQMKLIEAEVGGKESAAAAKLVKIESLDNPNRPDIMNSLTESQVKRCRLSTKEQMELLKAKNDPVSSERQADCTYETGDKVRLVNLENDEDLNGEDCVVIKHISDDADGKFLVQLIKSEQILRVKVQNMIPLESALKPKKKLLAEMSPEEIAQCRLPTRTQIEMLENKKDPTHVAAEQSPSLKKGYLTESEVRRKSVDEQLKIALQLSREDSAKGIKDVESLGGSDVPDSPYTEMQVRETVSNIDASRNRGLARENFEERLAYVMKMSYDQSKFCDDQKDLGKANPFENMTEAEQMAYLMNMTAASNPELEHRKSEEMQKLEKMTEAERLAYVMDLTADKKSEDVVLVPPDLHKMTSEEQMEFALNISANQHSSYEDILQSPKEQYEEPSFMICLTLSESANILNIKPQTETYWTLWQRVTSEFADAINGRQFTFQYKGDNIDMDQFGTTLADTGIVAGDELVVVFV